MFGSEQEASNTNKNGKMFLLRGLIEADILNFMEYFKASSSVASMIVGRRCAFLTLVLAFIDG